MPRESKLTRRAPMKYIKMNASMYYLVIASVGIFNLVSTLACTLWLSYMFLELGVCK